MFKTQIFCIVVIFILVLSGCDRASVQETSAQTTPDVNTTVPSEKQNGLDIGPYQVMLVDITDSSSNVLGMNMRDDLKDTETYKDREIPNQASIEVNGISYTGSLSTHSKGWDGYIPEYQYKATDPNTNRTIRFAYNAEGVLTNFFDYGISAEGHAVTEELCVIRAKAFLSEVVGIDSSDYVVESSRREDDTIAVSFNKYIEGIRSADCATVYFTLDGQIYQYVGSMLGLVSKDTENPFDKDAIVEALMDQLRERYATMYPEYTIVKIFEDLEARFTVLKDGRRALQVYIILRVTWPSIHDDGYSMSGCGYSFIIAEE